MGLLFNMWLSAAILLLRIPRDQCADIIGGRESIPHSRPFMAIIEGKDFCGGTLIKPNWVLTAAHCEFGKNANVILGAHSLREPETDSKQILKVTKQIRHPRFDKAAKGNDLMLLQLNESASINKNVSTIKLAKNFMDLKAGIKCLVAGWGIFDIRNKKTSDTLREVNVTVIERRICNDKNHYKSHPVITINMVCAGDKKGGKDACAGDSGGPLICDGIQRGVVSFGTKCGDSKFPGVYTRLTKKYDRWIKKTIGANL